MDAVVEILKGLDYSPLYVSLKTGIVATIFSFFLGLFAARRVIKAGPKVKAIADGILTLPMVLPPTAAGFFLLLLFSRRRPFGILLYEQFGIKVVQTWAGCIIAATVIAFPLMYRNARAAFEQIDVNLIQERLENMVRPPCLRAIFRERREPFPRGSQWLSRTAII